MNILNAIDAGPLAAAREYLKFGLSVIPVKVDGTKAPAYAGWREFATRRPTDVELDGWFRDPDQHAIGIVGGSASGNLIVLDFEQWPVFTRWGGLITAEDRGYLLRCPIVRTPSGGAHVYCRLTGPVAGCKLARTADGKCLIETRGDNHQVVAPGSPAFCHRTGIPYRLVRVGWLDGCSFEPIPIEAFNALTIHAVALNEYARPAAREVVGDRTGSSGGDRPGDHFNTRVNWSDILTPHGWRVFQTAGSTTFWSRPGKTPAGISASTGFCCGTSGNDLLYVFSTSAAPLEAETSYTRFGAYAVLNHRGDFSLATRALGQAGYGAPRQKRKAVRS